MIEKNETTHPCIPVSLTVLELFKTPKDAAQGLNSTSYSVEDIQI